MATTSLLNISSSDIMIVVCLGSCGHLVVKVMGSVGSGGVLVIV